MNYVLGVCYVRVYVCVCVNVGVCVYVCARVYVCVRIVPASGFGVDSDRNYD